MLLLEVFIPQVITVLLGLKQPLLRLFGMVFPPAQMAENWSRLFTVVVFIPRVILVLLGLIQIMRLRQRIGVKLLQARMA